MSQTRLAVVVLMTLIVGGLMAWQLARERRVAACLAAGHEWHGQTSTCKPVKVAPILQRDNLKRG